MNSSRELLFWVLGVAVATTFRQKELNAVGRTSIGHPLDAKRKWLGQQSQLGFRHTYSFALEDR